MPVAHERTATGLRCRYASSILALDWYGVDVLRVRVWQGDEPSTDGSLSVIARPAAPAGWSLGQEGDDLVVTGPALGARITAEGSIAFTRADRVLLSERAEARNFPANDLPSPEDRHGAAAGFTLDPADALYGLGQFPDGVMNWRGHDATLIHGNVTVVVPFLCATGGWGLLWDNPSHTTFHDGADGMTLGSEVADRLDYYVCAGGSMDGAIAGYRLLTGAAPLFPRAFYGFIQCKERYQTAAELTEVVREHRRRGLPLDVIVQDWQYWGRGMGKWSGMVHDPETFGDLPGAVREIHALHAKVMISIWPRIGLDTALGRELQERGHLFAGKPDSLDKVYDAFDDEARDIYWRHVRDGLFRFGIDAWWMDGTEPEFLDCHDPVVHKASLVAQRDTAAGSWARVLNAYCLATTRGVYEGQRAEDDAKRVFILTRSAWAGQQRHAAATWSGDISANWETFVRQIPAGLNFCLAGIPYWTTDNGAFFVRGRGGTFPRGVDDPAFREFFLRWFQYSCFCPLMRSHGTQTPREIWRFGEPGETIHDGLVAFDRLRMRLLPYSYSLAGDACLRGGTPMRALAMDFPRDARVHDIADQFLYGPALMACPVTAPMLAFPTETLDPVIGNDQIADDGAQGLTRRCYDGLDAAEPAHVDRIHWGFDFSWSGNKPQGITTDAYRVEVSGHLRPRRDRSAALIVRAAGRLRLDLDGERLVDDWTDGPLREHRIPFAPYADRTEIPLTVTYGHTGGDAVFQLGWEMQPTWQVRDPDAPLTRDVYLPTTTWYDFWTGECFTGGRTIALPAPLETMPVLARAGAILPLGPHKEWQDETTDDPLELRVYRGADGTFTLYEDAGDGYAYERGERSEIDFTWNDAARTLTIGARRGAFPGMLATRTFSVVIVREGHGGGIDPAPQPDHVVIYDGGAQLVGG